MEPEFPGHPGHPVVGQMIALTCYGNAYLGGESIPPFRDTRTGKGYYASANFVQVDPSNSENLVAESPDEWFEVLKAKNATGIRYTKNKYKEYQLGDLQVTKSDGNMDIYSVVWEEKEENEEWKTHNTYKLIETVRDPGPPHRNLEDIQRTLREALTDVRDFAEEHANGFCKTNFSIALLALDDPTQASSPYTDLWLKDQLSPIAQGLFLASFVSMVYGGMGTFSEFSFNDQSVENRYKAVTDRHSEVIYEAKRAAASSSHREIN